MSKLNFTTRKQTKKRGNILRTVGLVLSKRWHERSGRRLGKRNSVAEKGLRDITTKCRVRVWNCDSNIQIVLKKVKEDKKQDREI